MMRTIFLTVMAMIGFGGALIVKHYGYRVGLLDCPNSRSSHFHPTPKGGGIGIPIAMAVSSVLLEIPWYGWIPALLIALFSLISDYTEIAPLKRLIIHFLISFLFLFGWWGTESLRHLLLIIILAGFVTGTANIYNFMDGINGIAGLTGLIGFGLLGVYNYYIQNDVTITLWCLSIVAASAGFLTLNFPRARVFMGDVGSIQLGFLFGTVVCLASKSLLDFLCLISFMFPFYSDEIITKVVQILNGDGLTRPHRKHVYQLMANELGIPHWKISISFGLLQLLLGVSVLSVMQYGVTAVLLVLIAFFTFAIAVSISVRYMVQKAEAT